MTPGERAARGTRDRSRRAPGTKASYQAWEARAEQLEAWGMTLLEQAMARATGAAENGRKPKGRQPSGLEMLREFTAGRQLLDAADRLWQRLVRVAPRDRSSPSPESPNEPDDDLTAFNQGKHRR